MITTFVGGPSKRSKSCKNMHTRFLIMKIPLLSTRTTVTRIVCTPWTFPLSHGGIVQRMKKGSVLHHVISSAVGNIIELSFTSVASGILLTAQSLKVGVIIISSKLQIFENRSNLASNCRASNRKFLATFKHPIRNSWQLSTIARIIISLITSVHT